MSSETSDRISACSRFYGHQLEEKDVRQLQEMAKGIGIDDKDTMFLLLLMLQSHFKAVHGLNNGVLDAKEKMAGIFDEKFKSGLEKLSTSTKKLLIGGGIYLGVLVTCLSGAGGFFGSQQFYSSRLDSETMKGIRTCTKAGGFVQNTGNSSRLACFSQDGKGFFLE